jgi:hypothetical protein
MDGGVFLLLLIANEEQHLAWIGSTVEYVLKYLLRTYFMLRTFPSRSGRILSPGHYFPF